MINITALKSALLSASNHVMVDRNTINSLCEELELLRALANRLEQQATNDREKHERHFSIGVIVAVGAYRKFCAEETIASAIKNGVR